MVNKRYVSWVESWLSHLGPPAHPKADGAHSYCKFQLSLFLGASAFQRVRQHAEDGAPVEWRTAKTTVPAAAASAG